MSAECSKCGTDIVYPDGSWPLGECPVCGPSRWKRFEDNELHALAVCIEVCSDDECSWEETRTMLMQIENELSSRAAAVKETKRAR